MSYSLDIAAIFRQLDSLGATYGPRFIIGLSGGGDSMALAHICARWKTHSGGDVRALIVDHGLRAEAKHEAVQARAWAQALGLPAGITTYQGASVTRAVQERARQWRHEAFSKAAQAAGGAIVLLAHTLDDQAETIAFRLTRQTGLDGLAGMAEINEELIAHATVCRPLLHVRRETLRTYLRAHGQDWIEDPSNTNRAFSRIKVRDRLALLGGHDSLVRIGSHARALRDAQDRAGEELIAQCHLVQESGITRFDAEPFVSAIPAAQARLLQHVIEPKRPISPEKLLRLANSMTQSGFRARTLAGFVVSRKQKQFMVAPAPPRRRT